MRLRNLALFGLLFLALRGTAWAQTDTNIRNLNVMGTGTFTGANTFKNINNTLYASQFCGGSTDLGVCINNAIASTATPSLVVVDNLSPTTISTSPNLPLGWSITFYPNSLYTLATTWFIQHGGAIYNFSSAHFIYNQDTGAQAFFVTKNSSGTVNTTNSSVGACPSNCISFVSGTNFANIDAAYDSVAIAGSTFNICSVFSNILMRSCGATGTQTGAAYAAILGQTAPNGAQAGIEINNLTVGQANIPPANTGDVCFESDWVLYSKFIVECRDFISGTGIKVLGTEDSIIVGSKAFNNKQQFVADALTQAGLTLATTEFKIQGTVMDSSPASATQAILVQGGSSVLFDTVDIESNLSTTAVNLAASSGSIFQNCFFQGNGDGTASANDITVGAASVNNTIGDGNAFNATSTNHPAIGVLASSGSVGTIIKNNRWNNLYTTDYTFFGTATGQTQHNYLPGGAFVDPQIVLGSLGASGFGAGFAKVNQFSITGASAYLSVQTSSGSIPTAGAGQALCGTVSGALQCNYNAGATLPIPQVIASGTATMTIAAIAAGACGTTVTGTFSTGSAANILSTDTISFSFNAAPAANPAELPISNWPIAATSVNFQYCNPSAASVTPNAATLNWRVLR